MTTLTIVIVIAFVVGYALIALESVTRVNKAAVALLMLVVCWTLFMVDPGQYLGSGSHADIIAAVNHTIERHLGDMVMDGIFWQLLAYCAGVGGSILIIGSAAGVVVMGLEKISFGWYMRRITPVVLVGYLAGMLCYYLQRTWLM